MVLFCVQWIYLKYVFLYIFYIYVNDICYSIKGDQEFYIFDIVKYFGYCIWGLQLDILVIVKFFVKKKDLLLMIIVLVIFEISLVYEYYDCI